MLEFILPVLQGKDAELCSFEYAPNVSSVWYPIKAIRIAILRTARILVVKRVDGDLIWKPQPEILAVLLSKLDIHHRFKQ